MKHIMIMTLEERNRELLSRQSLMFDETELYRRCVILGCGFIGSNMAFNLMKTGFRRFCLVDFDTIETGNLLNQMYQDDDVGKKKTEALSQGLILNSPMEVDIDTADNIKDIISGKVELYEGDIVVLSADNVEIRKEFCIWLRDKVKNGEIGFITLVVVGTSSTAIWIGMSQNEVEFLDYLVNIYSQSKDKYSVGLCGEKSAYFMGSLVSGLVISNLKNFFLGKDDAVSKVYLYRNQTSELENLA